MQDRYTGDAGDFGKFGLMRALHRAGSSLRLGLIWYLYPDEDGNADGKHIRYLEPSARNDRRYRACDPELYERLRPLAHAVPRQVSDVPRTGILPPSTVYFDEPLDFPGPGRLAARDAWLARALHATARCDVVFLDPDNGLECASVQRHERRAGKYVFCDEIAPMLARGQTVVLYQHLDRSAPAPAQIERRARLLAERMGSPPLALRHRSGSSRVYYFLAQPPHGPAVHTAIAELTTGPWSRHFSPP